MPFSQKRCITILMYIALTFVSLMPFTGAANSATKCGERLAIVKQLSKTFKEKLHSRGLISEKLLMEVFVSSKGSWSVLFTSPKGKACVMATGKMWVDSQEKDLKPEV